ncbi:tyrosine-type recombinase/integrase [Streptomyces sp. ISL-10]|uniref:tyrosine-type recombinase/integrase n=1 Tax=Streptomyces sp. ISL-10 TaxID=2819172 RepID=UPI0027E512A2|nr:tyrosine-type recombinase/integrase [Streptomyces sp. ISL-10]
MLPETGWLAQTGDPWEPYQLLDSAGDVVEPVAAYFAELQAGHSSGLTIRSYGMDLLRWFRFIWALGVEWDRADRSDARDFARWMLLAEKPVRTHWRRRGEGRPASASMAGPAPSSPNSVTGKPAPGPKYAATTRAHCETVLRSFYDFHLDQGTGPVINPFPLDRSRRAGRANAHHNPMEPFKSERQGRYRPSVPKRIPRRIPDDRFNELFAGLRHNRDRALLAFWVSTGARAEELLTSRQSGADPGQQVIEVTRKGTGEIQLLPASPDAFMWLRLYQEECLRGGVPRGRHLPLWWTLRRPWRRLNYHAARAMFVRANEVLGANWSLHDLRHTAAYRMARDPQLPLTDVQWVLGHRQISTTQLYLNPDTAEVTEHVLAYHARRSQQREAAPLPRQGYNATSLAVLFGEKR